MTERKKEKRIPPWEKARIIIHLQEEQRKRKLLEIEMKQRQQKAAFRVKRPSPLDSLEENKKRLSEIRKRMEEGQEAE